jgi:hypothetical protein
MLKLPFLPFFAKMFLNHNIGRRHGTTYMARDQTCLEPVTSAGGPSQCPTVKVERVKAGIEATKVTETKAGSMNKFVLGINSRGQCYNIVYKSRPSLFLKYNPRDQCYNIVHKLHATKSV